MKQHAKFQVDPRNRVIRIPTRGAYDRQTIYAIVDRAMIVHVGFVTLHGPTVIPMFHARRDDQLLFHGAMSSRLMRHLVSGNALCITATLVDGIVLAKSLFHHSMNYRSVTLFGSGEIIEGDDAKMKALRAMSDKIAPGRWDDARAPNSKELKATMVATVQIDSASAKIRSGPPVDDEDDWGFPSWSGVIPVSMHMGEPTADEHSQGLPLPIYLDHLRRDFNSETNNPD